MRPHLAILARLAVGALSALGAGCMAADAASDDAHPLIVLAVDGMDPKLLRRFMEDGRTPNLRRMAEQGAFYELATSNPPQSPVAWSHFITGHASERHGIYDFLHRDLAEMSPYLSTSKAEGPAFTLPLGDWHVPVAGGGVELLRAGDPFWSSLHDSGVDSTVVKIPANYPPREPSGARVLSGMGTPDLLGTPGTFSVYTTDPTLAALDVSGGDVIPLDFELSRSAKAELTGPPDPVAADGRPMTLPLEVVVDDVNDSALVRFGDSERLIRVGEWSDWIEVEFEGELPGVTVTGMVRAHLRAVGARVTLYVSPVNLDPMDPAQDISSPPEYAADIARDVGRFYTQGMPEDTKALSSGVLTDEEFLAQSGLVLAERKRILKRSLDELEGGFLFFYFSSVDLTSHMFWRTLKPTASEEEKKLAHVIPDLYAEIDAVVGDVRDRIPEATVLVMSDHGFGPYDWKVNLNAWLAEKGYLALRDEPGPGPLGHVDWSLTRAYALGLNQLFVNLEGREAHGVVPVKQRDALLARLKRDLEELRNPANGERVVSRAFVVDVTEFPEHAPDMIVGYNLGYRSSDESALGNVGPVVVEKNTSKWSGDHCIDPAYVPGVLLSNAPLPDRPWALTDIGELVRAHFTGGPLLPAPVVAGLEGEKP